MCTIFTELINRININIYYFSFLELNNVTSDKFEITIIFGSLNDRILFRNRSQINFYEG
jgi:hypothetical protein